MQSYLPIRNSLVGIHCRIYRDIFLNFLRYFCFCIVCSCCDIGSSHGVATGIVVASPLGLVDKEDSDHTGFGEVGVRGVGVGGNPVDSR